MGCVGQTCLIHRGSTSQLTGPKDLTVTFWCQMPQHTFRELVESMNHKADLHNIRQAFEIVESVWPVGLLRSWQHWSPYDYPRDRK